MNGKKRRMERLFRRGSGRLFIVPMDHSLTDGPIGKADTTSELLATLGQHGADAVVLHKGRAASIRPQVTAELGLIVHLSGSTAIGGDSNGKVLVASVEDALRLGADAVSVHVNIGCRTESQQLEDFGSVASVCASWGMPLLAMMYARGDHAQNPSSPATLAHLAAIAVDLGADMVKLVYAGSVTAMSEAIATCPIPVVVAGGGLRASEDETLDFVRDVLDSGAAGLAIGRNVFASPDPARLTQRIGRLVHEAADTPPTGRLRDVEHQLPATVGVGTR